MDGMNDCRHHWVIDTADGPMSRGVCKYCQQVRDFENFVEGDKWGYFHLDGRDPVTIKGNPRQSKGSSS